MTRVKKIFGKILMLAVLSSAPVGCRIVAKDAGAPLAATGEAGALKTAEGLKSFSDHVHPYLRNNCASCHENRRPPYFAATSNEQSFDEIAKLVNFTSPAFSKVVRKSMDTHCGAPCTTDGAELTSKIVAWKAAYSEATLLPGGPPSQGNVFTSELPLPERLQTCGRAEDLLGPQYDQNGSLVTPNKCWTILRFPFAQIRKKTGEPAFASDEQGWFEAQVAQVPGIPGARTAYTIRNLRVVSMKQPIYVHGIRFFLRGDYKPNYGAVYEFADSIIDKAGVPASCTVAFTAVTGTPSVSPSDCRITAPPLVNISAGTSGVVAEAGDGLSFSFEYLQTSTAEPCKAQGKFNQLVFSKIETNDYASNPPQLACLKCHWEGGDVSAAGQRFNMSHLSAVNNKTNPDGTPLRASNGNVIGNTPAERKEVICRKFLQRSFLKEPGNSTWIRQARTGLNGMPAQPAFSAYYGDLCGWVKAEAEARGIQFPDNPCVD